MDNITITRATPDDIRTLQQIGRQTFEETFTDSNSKEVIARYLDKSFAIDKLMLEISNSDSQFYFAMHGGEVIGYLKLNTGKAQTELQDVTALEIERIYVLATYHGKKVGQLLYNKAMQVAHDLKCNYVWLGVWEQNPRAIRFYEKTGFVPFDKHIFRLGGEEQTDIMMKKVLKTDIGLQPLLENDRVILYPLKEDDFQTLYHVAADPAIWAQHPNKDRWKEDVFRNFFEGALQSGGAFRIVDKATGETIGSTRFYDYSVEERSIFIGYTFYATAYWGKGINLQVKALMLDYAFQFADSVFFHIGAQNLRSQIAIGRLGAVKTGEQEVCYFGEAPKQNFVYCITKTEWFAKKGGAQRA
ncbi:GNAT family N-acetyltransferase [Mucilaginibacter roseus]|uniref:GNAT family N-acetyltransferase n=1 Tax=Mucilaginibacter roseus TaxID=1528868 RepID=A0ABS8U1M0_9SPHI|nr:GNAT family N-acetyltransferase [Mucilaginibacter roseus]MCD8741013.1 GNAT family N-acetyltransferase [Mucilaginibacter roseus]